MRTFFLVPFFLLLLSGCAPKVVVDMFTAEFQPVAADSVRVLRMYQQVPPNTLAIGDVKVVDNGLSVGTFERVMKMAVEATAQHGGNGLVVTQVKEPDRRSTIHRVWGTMLHIPEEGLAWMERQKTDSTVWKRQAEAEMRRYEEAIRHREEQQMMAQRADSVRRAAPRNRIRVGVGPSWMVSKYQIGNRTYKSRAGIDFQADYEHIWSSGFIFRINYLHNNTNFDEGVKTSINYVGPCFVIEMGVEHLRAEIGIGLGYAAYTEKYMGHSVTESRLAGLMHIAMEWKVARHLAIGLNTNMFTMGMKKPDGMELEKGEFYGIRHIGLQGGLRFYF